MENLNLIQLKEQMDDLMLYPGKFSYFVAKIRKQGVHVYKVFYVTETEWGEDYQLSFLKEEEFENLFNKDDYETLIIYEVDEHDEEINGCRSDDYDDSANDFFI